MVAPSPSASLAERFDATYNQFRSGDLGAFDATSPVSRLLLAIATFVDAADRASGQRARPGQYRRSVRARLLALGSRPATAVPPPPQASDFLELAVDAHLGATWRASPSWPASRRPVDGDVVRWMIGGADLRSSGTSAAAIEPDGPMAALVASIAGHRVLRETGARLDAMTGALHEIIASPPRRGLNSKVLEGVLAPDGEPDAQRLATAAVAMEQQLEQLRAGAFPHDPRVRTIIQAIACTRPTRELDKRIGAIGRDIAVALVAGDVDQAMGTLRDAARRHRAWFTEQALDAIDPARAGSPIEPTTAARRSTSTAADLAWLSRSASQVWLDPDAGTLLTASDQFPVDDDRRVLFERRALVREPDTSTPVGTLRAWGHPGPAEQTNAAGLRRLTSGLVPLLEEGAAQQIMGTPFSDQHRVRVLAALVERGEIVLDELRLRTEATDELRRRTAADLQRAGQGPPPATSTRRRSTTGRGRSDGAGAGKRPSAQANANATVALCRDRLLAGTDEHGPWIGVLELGSEASFRYVAHLHKARRIGEIGATTRRGPSTTVALWSERVPVDLTNPQLARDIATGSIQHLGAASTSYLAARLDGATYTVDLPHTLDAGAVALVGSAVPEEALAHLATRSALPVRASASERSRPGAAKVRSASRMAL